MTKGIFNKGIIKAQWGRNKYLKLFSFAVTFFFFFFCLVSVLCNCSLNQHKGYENVYALQGCCENINIGLRFFW